MAQLAIVPANSARQGIKLSLHASVGAGAKQKEKLLRFFKNTCHLKRNYVG